MEENMLKRGLNILLIVAFLAVIPVASVSSDSNVSQPKPIGAIIPDSIHMVAPRNEVVVNHLEELGVIKKDSPPDVIQSALENYKQNFSKKTDTYVSAEIQKKIEDHENASASNVYSAQEDPSPAAVSVQVFALAVDFSGTETFTYNEPNGTSCSAPITTTFTGPSQGEILPPDPGDNNTIYYAPEQTADPNFYSKLIFGYEGVGRVRNDLVDPQDGRPGINLAGYTVQDYYDHFAGKGNVTLNGAVEGWVTVDHTEAYYGIPYCNSTSSDNDGGNVITVDGKQKSVPPAQLVADALTKFMAEHPDYYTDTSASAFWKQFDANKDGIVDTMWTIHAGRGEEAGGGAQGSAAIWSHSFALSAYRDWPKGFKVYEGNPTTTADDIYVDPYTIQPEDADLGVFVEEFGHNFFGLPDLYATDVNNSIGDWTEMSGGSWMGPLGGSIPAGMPLWFRMNAYCGDDFCNWQYPMITRDYKDVSADVTIGQMEDFPGGAANKGIRINLPNVPENIKNLAGSGKAIWSGKGINNTDESISRQITVPASGANELTMNSFWDIEYNYDYGYVMVKDGSADWVFLSDKDGLFTDGPLAGSKGLTGTSPAAQPLRFDLSPYAGKTITLRFRYVTDPGVTKAGWFIDDLKLDSALLNDFENTALPDTVPGWTNDPIIPWQVVPYAKTYASYYLVEWRSHTKYDDAMKYAYVTTASKPNLWTVERVPYNIPGALVYYRNAKYPDTYIQSSYDEDDPSYGPKNKLLIVDMNYQPMLIGMTGYQFSGSISSYDAALTLQPSADFNLSSVLGVSGGPYHFAAKAPVTSFNDTLGYYAGIYLGDPCPDVCVAGGADSAVIPARGNYSTRITDFAGNPLYDYYGLDFPPSVVGSGNPGDDNVQHGVNIKLLSKSADDSTAVIRVYNYSVDLHTTVRYLETSDNVYDVWYDTAVENTGTETAKNIRLIYNLDSQLDFIEFTSTNGVVGNGDMSAQGLVKTYNIPSLATGQKTTVTLHARMTVLFTGSATTGISGIPTKSQIEANDGQVLRGPYWFEKILTESLRIYLPMIGQK